MKDVIVTSSTVGMCIIADQEYITNRSVQRSHMHAPPAFSRFDVRDKPPYKPPFAMNNYDYTAGVRHSSHMVVCRLAYL